MTCLGGHPAPCRAADLWQTVTRGFEYNLKTLGFGTFQQAADSAQNPANDFLQIPRYMAELEVRPDARLTLWRFDFSVKPRLHLAWQAWEDGRRAGDTEVDAEVFVNAWLARFRLTESLVLSYGRENLQWGPAFLFSPSNPFFRDNGRLNPKREVPGADFARLVWLPGSAWTLSLLANLDAGRQEFHTFEFQKTYALKLDYTGPSAYASVMPSYQEGGRFRLGWFAGWTATDALLFSMEGTLARGIQALYPVAARHPFGASLAPVKDDDKSLAGIILLGGAYTLDIGSTLTMEYIYNGPGYSSDQAKAYYQLRQQAAHAFTSAGPLRDLARLTLSQTADPGLRLLRRHYVLLQYVHNNIDNVLNLTLRWTQNLNDYSGQCNAILEYFLGDHVQLFSVGAINAGGRHTEFGTFLRYQIMIGVELSF
jgi:hypothetical protein